MNVEQLKAVVWVARLKGFAAAASKLNTTQPAISSRIRCLEEELGVPLFERTTRSVKVTPEGRKCLASAERIVELMGDIKSAARPSHYASGAVIVGATEAIATTWLTGLMGTLSSDYPSIEIDVDVGATRYLFDRLRAGEVDVILVGGIPDNIPVNDLAIESLGRLSFRWMAARHYEPLLESRGPLTPRDLQNHRVICYTKRSFMFYRVDQWFREGDARMERYILCDSLPLVTSLVMSGQGIGLLPLTGEYKKKRTSSMKVLQVQPELSPLEYFAVFPTVSTSPIPKLLAQLARKVSTFS